MSKSKLDHAEPGAEESRVREFTRIERENAPDTSDPKIMAMTKAKKAMPMDFSEAKTARDTE
ncbi:hypothetical protein LNKW23_28180 [Paralimibaculum aggregatum]|uniref:Uncharacterized protein n=1 Tax=Paralimibaculum aggregatum TaxID=3036245 RepID=A0ABQ6LRD6_9RHOB|nr:hypothetical protein [Limibaculum sp. NKW23]GMG83605.1 hypothetical protein LNKW23_28180 [Limibaculum sp. NKW23]